MQEMTLSDTILHNLPGPLCVIDKNYNFIRANKEFMDIYNIDAESLSSLDPLATVVEEEKEKLMKMMKEAFETGHAEVETIITVNGKNHHYYINAKLVEENDQTYLIGNGVDISDRVKAQKNNEILLQEVHHRVKNNLAIISGLLLVEMEEMEDTEFKLPLQRSIQRIFSMAKVHELLYSTSNFATIPIKKYFKALADEIKNSFSESQNVQIQFDIEDLEINVNEAIPLGMLMNELLTNSIKYAFEDEEGQIFIALSEEDNMYRFLYRDNGMGLKKKPDLQNPSTLGMQIISTLLDQLEAEYSLDVDKKFALEFEFKQRLKGSHSNLTNQVINFGNTGRQVRD